MTTLIDTIKPTEEYIESVLNEHALSGRSEEEYISAYLKGLVARLKVDAYTYRSFGPWWPSLKALLLKDGHTDFGQIVDGDVAAIYTMSRPALTLVAAHLYADEVLESGNIHSAVHFLSVMPSADDTEPYQYTSYDESIEKFKLTR